MHNQESSAESKKEPRCARRDSKGEDRVAKMLWEGNSENGRVEFICGGESRAREAGEIKTTKDDWESHKGPLFYIYLKQHMYFLYMYIHM